MIRQRISNLEEKKLEKIGRQRENPAEWKEGFRQCVARRLYERRQIDASQRAHRFKRVRGKTASLRPSTQPRGPPFSLLQPKFFSPIPSASSAKLPHHLVASFKGTLEEVVEADILLHVIDVCHPKFDEQIKVVTATLEELGVAGKPTLYVFNKIDALQDREHLQELQHQFTPSCSFRLNGE